MKKKSWITYPLVVWSALFIVVPVLLVIFFSFTEKVDDSYIFSLTHYKRLMNPVYFSVFFRSIWLALISTVICLLIGYPIAYILAKKPENKRNFFLLVFILPMWMNFLLRTYAWMSILGRNGIINSILTTIGLKPLDLLYSNGAVLLVMAYNFLPFMVLPIYTSLTKIDKDVINAAYDLGAKSSQVFRRVIFPLSIPGVVSGITMVFMPAVSTFVISRLLGGGQYMLVGNLIEQQFTTVGDWNFGSAISIFMMILILISMAIMNKFTDEGDREGGGLL